MISACTTLKRSSAYRSSAAFSSAISSRDRKRVSLGRRFGSMDPAGLLSMRPRAMAKLRLWRRSFSAWFAPPGADAL